MAKQLIPTKIYKDITEVLISKKLIKEIPPQKWTTNCKVYGYLRTCRYKNVRTGKITEKHLGLYLNKAYCPCTLKDLLTQDSKKVADEIVELIDTICHELAHMTHHDHSSKHKDLTELYKTAYYSSFRYNIDILMEGIFKDCKEA